MTENIRTPLSFDYTLLKLRIKDVFGSQQKFAEALKISKQYLNMKLNSRTAMTTEDVIRYSEALKINPDDYKFYFFSMYGSTNSDMIVASLKNR